MTLWGKTPPGFLVLGLLLVACTARPDDPVVHAVDPSSITGAVQNSLEIQGSNFFNPVHVQLDDRDPADVDARWRVLIGGIEIEAVTWVNATSLAIGVPPGLPLGVHDVVVISPDNRAAMLADGIQVTDQTPTGSAPVNTTTNEDVALTLSLTGSDLEDGEVGLQVTITRQPDHGTLTDLGGTILSGGSAPLTARYNPASNYNGGDGFEFTVSDTEGGVSPPVAVALTVVAVNDVPVGGADAAMVNEDLTLVTAPPGVLGNDTDVDADPLTAVLVTDVTNGTLALASDGSYTYTPDLNFNGADSFTYRANDGTVDSADTTVSLTINAVNDAPVANDDAYATTQTIPLTIAAPGVLSNDTDVESNPFTAVLDAGPSDGMLTLNPDGSFVYTPDPTFNGTDSFTYHATDGDDSGVATVTITVAPAALEVAALVLPAEVNRGQSLVRVEMHVFNNSGGLAQLTGAGLTFTQGADDVSADYTVRPEPGNALQIPSGQTVVLVFRISVNSTATLGTVTVAATVEGFLATIAGFSMDSATDTWDVLGVPGPTAIISAPVPEANRLCVNGPVTFNGSTSMGAASFLWELAGGNPSSSTAAVTAPIQYSTLGSFANALTVADAGGIEDTAVGIPIFVGGLEALADDQYPTGTVFIDAPTPGANVALDTLPSGEIDMDAGTPLQQCDGTTVPAGGANDYLTIFVDRGTIDPAMDYAPGVPGIQIELEHGGDHFDNLDLYSNDDPIGFAPSAGIEGPAMVYLEYQKQPEGVVTASGFVEFNMIDDLVGPVVDATFPEADCGAACYGKGQRWLFRFNEPMDPASLTDVTVSWKSSSNCSAGGYTDITATSSVSYDPEARVLSVIPESQSPNTYSVRVTLGAGNTDSAVSLNPLTPLTRCGVLEDRTTAVPAGPASVTVSPDPFSPDGDGTDETATFQLDTDAESTAIRIDISRGFNAVRTRVEPAAGAGTHSVTWDGRDNSGRMVPDGYYKYRITVENGDGTASTAHLGVIEVDSAVSFVGVAPRF